MLNTLNTPKTSSTNPLVTVPPDSGEYARETDLLHAALDYALRGWAVFPVAPGAKRPLTPHGVKDASRCPAAIRRWWARWPGANIGLACGAPSRLFVIDIDVKHGVNGYDAWYALCDAHGWRDAPYVLTTVTPSSGSHVYFQHVPGITNARGVLPAGIDVRGEGGYVLLPPSMVEGKPYQWAYTDAARLPQAPEWLLHVLTSPSLASQRPRPHPVRAMQPQPAHAYTPGMAHPHAYGMPGDMGIGVGVVERILHTLAAATPGTRNNLLLWSACRLLDGGMPQHEVESLLLPLAHSIGLSLRECKSTLHSAAQQERRPLRLLSRQGVHATLQRIHSRYHPRRRTRYSARRGAPINTPAQTHHDDEAGAR